MANVDGLRPEESNTSRVRSKRGGVVTNRTTQRTVGVSPRASAVDTFVGAPASPNDNRLGQLAEALSGLNPAIQGAYSTHQKARLGELETLEADQMKKMEWYRANFQKDKAEGAVTQAQIKNQFPELVPTVAAKIAESQGALEAEDWTQAQVQEILENPTLRLDTKARNAHIEKLRQEALKNADQGDFYGNGFMSSFDKTINQFETSWMQETAAHHEKIQADKFGKEVSEALLTGGDLTKIDAAWKQTGSLDNLQRNDLVFDTAVNLAIQSNDPEVLSKIPERFMNAEKKANIVKLKADIESANYQKWVQSRSKADYAREQSIRSGKTDILNKIANGDIINPLDYRATPELTAYAQQWADRPTVNPTQSKVNLKRLSSSIVKWGTAGGDTDRAFTSDPEAAAFFENKEVTEDTLYDHVLTRSDLSPSDKQKIIDEIPQLLEGAAAMRDEDVASEMRLYITPALNDLTQSPSAEIQALIAGKNLRARTMDSFQSEVASSFQAHYEETGEWPKGEKKRSLIRAARQEAVALMEHMSSIKGINQPAPAQAPQAAPKAESKAAPTRVRRWNPETGKMEEVPQ